MSEMSATPAAAQPKADRALATKLEAAHGWCVSQFAASIQRLRPQVGAAVMPMAGGLAIYAGPSPFSFTVGVGMTGPVSISDIERIEHFFTSRKHSVRIDVTPFSDPSLLQLLTARSYKVSEITSVWVLDLRADLPARNLPDHTVVRWATAVECELWVDVVAKCFFVQEPGTDRRANMAALFNTPNSLNTLASIDGTIVGAAGGMLPDDRDVVPLFGSATLPDFRRRGIHRAMLHFRLDRARAEGCKLALITATPGSDSERNLKRFGFVECYQKITYALAG